MKTRQLKATQNSTRSWSAQNEHGTLWIATLPTKKLKNFTWFFLKLAQRVQRSTESFDACAKMSVSQPSPMRKCSGISKNRPALPSFHTLRAARRTDGQHFPVSSGKRNSAVRRTQLIEVVARIDKACPGGTICLQQVTSALLDSFEIGERDTTQSLAACAGLFIIRSFSRQIRWPIPAQARINHSADRSARKSWSGCWW